MGSFFIGGAGMLSDNARNAPLVAIKCALQSDIAKLFVTQMRHHDILLTFQKVVFL